MQRVPFYAKILAKSPFLHPLDREPYLRGCAGERGSEGASGAAAGAERAAERSFKGRHCAGQRGAAQVQYVITVTDIFCRAKSVSERQHVM